MTLAWANCGYEVNLADHHQARHSEVRIYLEGGGRNNKALRLDLQQSMRAFLKRAGVNPLPKVIACGGRQATYDAFCKALGLSAKSILLVDSEGPLTEEFRWSHLSQRDGWKKPTEATEEHCHLMVQQMESWFLADIEALERYYGKNFHKKSLPPNQHPETVDRRRLIQALEKASKETTKGSYSKGKHQCDILRGIDPERVRLSCPHCDKLFDICRKWD